MLLLLMITMMSMIQKHSVVHSSFLRLYIFIFIYSFNVFDIEIGTFGLEKELFHFWFGCVHILINYAYF